MQGTMDIMAIMQKSGLAKQKTAAMSFSNNAAKTSFKSELAEARKNTSSKSTDGQDIDQTRQTTVSDNRIEKLSKVMSSNKTITDKVEDAAKEIASDIQKLTDNQKANAAEDSGATKLDVQLEEPAKEVKLESETALTELVESAQELLQQIIQLFSGTENVENTQEDVKQLEASIQAISQKLEQLLALPTASKAEEPDAVLKNLKAELKDLIKQLKTQEPDINKNIVDKPSLLQTVNTLKQLINKMNEVKPILQQKLANPEATLENAEPNVELQVKQSKDFDKTTKDSSDIQTSNENIKTTISTEANAKENTGKDSDSEDTESKKKLELKDASKHQAAVDKHKSEGFKLFNTQQNDKVEVQINLKELNLNQKKEQMVTINKSDIINQVAKKADIIIREGHSEMVMKLEPESLGKLNLKVIVEKGLITAKFIAESQQVKEVIESNFNQLKDALQEKGIAVQSFSVSVGQQAGDSSSNQSFNQWKQSLKLNNKAAGEFIGLDDEAVLNQNPYNYHEGKFDYRA